MLHRFGALNLRDFNCAPEQLDCIIYSLFMMLMVFLQRFGPDYRINILPVRQTSGAASLLQYTAQYHLGISSYSSLPS
jgi:hypothetical protein